MDDSFSESLSPSGVRKETDFRGEVGDRTHSPG
jgi:hypothetical protein